MKNILPIIPVIDYSVRTLCTMPYTNHPKGCPNHSKRDACPPRAKRIEEVFDFSHTIYCIYNKFNFGEHVSKMYDRHPNWTKRQAECCLYWQGTARKQLREKVTKFLITHPDYIALFTPEACGVNVTATMKKLGITLEWSPKNFTYQVVLCGKPIK